MWIKAEDLKTECVIPVTYNADGPDGSYIGFARRTKEFVGIDYDGLVRRCILVVYPGWECWYESENFDTIFNRIDDYETMFNPFWIAELPA